MLKCFCWEFYNMDFIIEVLFELFGEIIANIFVHFFAWLLSVIVTDLDSSPVKRKRLKIVIYSLCFIACIVLLVLSFIYAKTAYALLVSIFLAINIFILGVKLINKTYINENKYLTILIIVISRISRVAFYVLMFVFLNTLKTDAAKATMISISSVLMAAFICIDIYKISKYYKKKKYDNTIVY